jgi:peptidoglycan L-alanyl-D-glutamate endopeptidase CwlK
VALVKYKNRLKGVHPDLIKVVEEFERSGTVSVTVSEGKRTLAQQKIYVKEGKSKTLNSRHLTGHAIDILPIDSKGQLINSWLVYTKMAKEMKTAAKKVGVSIKWGGDWTKFRDGPHFELNRSVYAAGLMTGMPAETVLSSALKKIGAMIVTAVSSLSLNYAPILTTIQISAEQYVTGDTVGKVLALAAIAGVLYASYKSYQDVSDHQQG